MYRDRKKRLHRKLMTLLSQLRVDDDTRHAMVWQFTGGRTNSTRELSYQELRELVNRLEQDAWEEIRRLRSEILAMATRTGIHDPENWDKFNRFMLNRSVYHKPLNSYTLRELEDLRRQFRAIERKYKAAQKKKILKIYPN